MPKETEETEADVHTQAVSFADEVGREADFAAGQFMLEDALQIEQLLLCRLSALADGGQRGVLVGNSLDALLDAAAIFFDMHGRAAGRDDEIALGDDKVG